ncbi:hypothetical protein QVD17_28204 [Tagetes erecta]|uniref:DWNN domain-containing protein n=1 Tax=Tagetes erecta TaxID=13708 RepID=A0AAD8KCD7_TARER|nr:hypothetical protein QVD17_28204 [Tagetes erecta]
MAAVYYKFKSAKDYDSVSLDGHFITLISLKQKIYECKQLHRGTDYDLIVTNAQTNEEYLDEDMLIPKNTSVLVRRIPGQPRKPLSAAPVTQQPEPKEVNEQEKAQPAKSNVSGAALSVTNYTDGSEFDEFGGDLYEIPEVVPIMSNDQPHDASAASKDDEDSKIQALIDTPALDWKRQSSDRFGVSRGFGRGTSGRMGARGFGRGCGFEGKTPPPGYVCHRCKTPGHFIQHCATNGDPSFDIKRVKPPTGIPKSMLMATTDGSYALPSGAVAVLKPNEAVFEKEVEGMPSTRSVGDLPPELHCPLCKQVMKDAVLTSKCCFTSFCDKCIRDHIIDKSACVCGATNVLADDLIPNKTLRDTINRILESNTSSAENGSSVYHVQDTESAKCAPPSQSNNPSPTPSATSKGEQTPPQDEDKTKMQSVHTEHDATRVVQQTASGLEKLNKASDVSETSQGGGRPVDEVVQQKQVPTEAVKKKKKKMKKVNMPISAENYALENYMIHPDHITYNPYWNGGMYPYAGGYGLGVFPQDPFSVAGGSMMPPFIPPQRDMGMSCGGGPVMSRNEFEARRAELKRKRDIEKRGGSGGGIIQEARGSERPISSPSSDGHPHRTTRPSPDRHRSRNDGPDAPPRSLSKRKTSSDCYDNEDHSKLHQHQSQQHKSHRLSESSPSIRRHSQAPPSSDSKPAATAEATSGYGDYESSDEDRHFKRRHLRYKSSPARERDRDREHYYSKHRI